jgi:Flp pilus assembly protein TadD
MKRAFIPSRRLASSLAVAALLAAPFGAHAMDSSPPASSSRRADDPLGPARKAIEAKDWALAIQLLGEQETARPNDADVYNLLGFSERQRGNLAAAFAYYDKALKLNPKHRGAHEYVGEAWLLAGNLAKAQEQLAALDKLCFFSCEEYRDLKRSIAEYKRKHPAER